MQKLSEISTRIFSDIQSSTRKHYRQYAQQLTSLLSTLSPTPSTRQPFAIAFYNLAKLSNRYRYLQTALQFIDDEQEKMRSWLQMLALASSKGSHGEAHEEACKLIQHILEVIQGLKLEKELEMFAREIVQLIHRLKSTSIVSVNALNELQMSRKFQTDCMYVTKQFHIADIMIMQAINPTSKPKPPSPSLSPAQTFFLYIVYLSIACFTRATERFYLRDRGDKDFHLKAIEIASYLYSSKSTYMRFLRRTYREHYLEHLDQIEEVCEFGEMKVPVLGDPEEVPLGVMPWDGEETVVEEEGQERGRSASIYENREQKQIQNTEKFPQQQLKQQ